MKKIVAVLVAYNPDLKVLRENIDALSPQVDSVLLMNNSTTNIPVESKCVTCINLGRNLGIAKAQSIGMEIAFVNKGADFVLQMDQDSVPSYNMVDELVACFSTLSGLGYNVGLVGISYYDARSSKIESPIVNHGDRITGTDYILVDDILSSGSLISREAYECVGGMLDDLFIDAVDFEYCWRLQKSGFVVVKNPNAILGHRVGEGSVRFFLFNIKKGAPIRLYYSFRNSVYLFRFNYLPKYWRAKVIIKMFVKILVYPIIFDQKRRRLYYMLKGIWDGLHGRLGEYK